MEAQDDLRLPDLEIVVNASAFTVAVISFYRREDIHEGFEVVAGISSRDELKAIREVLSESIKALSTNDWVNVDELRAWLDEDEEPPPF